MAIRNAAKAIIISDGKVLLNKYINKKGRTYYELPGGGQLQYESMEDAVIRECMEETGYSVRVIRLAAIAEEIYDDIDMRNKFPDYVHRIHHIFLAEIEGDKIGESSELDYNQVGSYWFDIDKVQELPLIPRQLKENYLRVIHSDSPVYLGTVHEESL